MMQNLLSYVVADVDEASISENPGPKLNSNDTKDEEHEETEKQDVTQHRQCVQ